MLDDGLQPFGDDRIDRGIERQRRRKRDAQIRRINVIAFNPGGVGIPRIETRHRLERERGVRDVAGYGCNDGYTEKRLGESGTIWDGAV